MENVERTALDLWREVTAATLATPGPDLTARQQALLLTIHLDAGPHTVRGLSAGLGIGKPAVTRGLDLLEHNGLIRREPDPADRRSVLITGTESGAALLSAMASGLASALAAATGSVTPEERQDNGHRAVAMPQA
jgi:DNA-binding MarR family transcriptional regulator